MAKKNYVIDTSVFLSDPNSLYKFYNNDIFIPLKVLEEIDKHKKRQDSVGHNARKFDMPLIENEFFRCGMIPPKPLAIFDTLEAVRRLKIPRPHNLGAQCSRHGIDLSKAHDAAADAAASLLLLWKIMRDHPSSFRRGIKEVEQWLISGEIRNDESELGRSLSDLQSLDEHGRIRIEDGVYILGFGRHRGTDIITVLKQDPRYVDWLLSPKGIEDEDARNVLSEFISSIRDR